MNDFALRLVLTQRPMAYLNARDNKLPKKLYFAQSVVISMVIRETGENKSREGNLNNYEN